jgi:2-polyprenyl-6-methoxyphenol hydroxylase-like FAD-dependent oxidoreductase
MLAGELRLGGVRPLVLERQPQIRDIPKAGGLSGQILELLRYRGELERFEAASTAPRPAPERTRPPFGGPICAGNTCTSQTSWNSWME